MDAVTNPYIRRQRNSSQPEIAAFNERDAEEEFNFGEEERFMEEEHGGSQGEGEMTTKDLSQALQGF